MSTPEVTPPAPRARVYTALLAAQREFPAVHKGSTAKVETKSGGTFSYSYASLPQILDLVLPVLHEHGLVLWQAPINLGAGPPILRTVIAHAESGEELVSEFVLVTERPGMQGLGSAITFGRRYALTAMLGLAPDDDDDGAATQPPPAESKPKRESKPKTPDGGRDITEKEGAKPAFTEPAASDEEKLAFRDLAERLLAKELMTLDQLQRAAKFDGDVEKIKDGIARSALVDLTERLGRYYDTAMAERLKDEEAKAEADA